MPDPWVDDGGAVGGDSVGGVETSPVESGRGLAAFSAWAVCGALWAFSFLSFAGLRVLPPALLLTWLLHRNTGTRPYAVGVVAGAAALLLYIGLVHLSDRPCPESGSVTVESGEPGFSCGGLNGVPWLVAGIALMGISVGLFFQVRGRMREQPIDMSV